VVDRWLERRATIALTTRGKDFILLAVARRGVWVSLALSLVLLTAASVARAAPDALFTVSPAAPFTNETVTFTSTATGIVEPQQWDLDGDGACDDASGSVAQRSFPLSGSYWIRLCVSDGSHWWTDTSRVTVQNRPPLAAFTYAPFAPTTGERIVLTSTSADPDGPLVAQGWDLDGDGAFDDAAGPAVELSFPSAGVHLVRLAVMDRDGATAAATLPITVQELPAEPITPFPIVSMLAAVADRGTRVEQLVIRAPAGARVRVRCRGRSCPFRAFGMKADAQAHAARIVRIKRFRRHLLRPGTVIEIRVTKRGEIGKFTRFLIRKGKPPKRTDRCLPPGAKRPRTCAQ
jgi:PKD domain-containing protein